MPDADGDTLCWSVGGTTASTLASSFAFVTQPIRLRKCEVVRAIEPKALQWRFISSGDGFASRARTSNRMCAGPEAPGDVIASGPTLQFKAACEAHVSHLMVVVCDAALRAALPALRRCLRPRRHPRHRRRRRRRLRRPRRTRRRRTRPSTHPVHGYSIHGGAGVNGDYDAGMAHCAAEGANGVLAMPATPPRTRPSLNAWKPRGFSSGYVWIGLRRPASFVGADTEGYVYANGLALEADMYQPWARTPSATTLWARPLRGFIPGRMWKARRCTVNARIACQGIAPPPSPAAVAASPGAPSAATQRAAGAATCSAQLHRCWRLAVSRGGVPAVAASIYPHVDVRGHQLGHHAACLPQWRYRARTHGVASNVKKVDGHQLCAVGQCV